MIEAIGRDPRDPTGSAHAGHRQRIRVHSAQDQGPDALSRCRSSARRLSRSGEPSVHRELVRQDQAKGGVAQRLRDVRRRAPSDRALCRSLSRPPSHSSLGYQTPNEVRACGKKVRLCRNQRPEMSTLAGSRSSSATRPNCQPPHSFTSPTRRVEQRVRRSRSSPLRDPDFTLDQINRENPGSMQSRPVIAIRGT